jgi:hypothetical protein
MNEILSSPSGAAVAVVDTGVVAAQARRLNLLKQISALGGNVTPKADVSAPHGYRYPLEGDDPERDLQILSTRNYLEARFFDRVSLCPKCDSHHLNVREICPGCRRAHLSADGLLHHFACGYVGIPSEFSPAEDGSYLCPKCNRRMHHLGTEFDRLGKAFVCRGCGVISENPPVEAVCLACGTRSRAEDLVSTAVFSYLITSRGAAAVRRGSLLDADDEPVTVADAPVYRRQLMRGFLDHELRRLEHFNTTFSLLLVKYAPTIPDRLSASVGPWLTRLHDSLRDVDVFGQVGDTFYVVILPQTKEREAQLMCETVTTALGSDSPLTLSFAEIRTPQDLAQVLPVLTARAEP